MANRKSWRRAAGPPSNRAPSRPAHKPLSTPFVGISSAALSSMLHLLIAKDVTLSTVDGAVHTGLFAGTEHAPDGLRFVLTFARSRPRPPNAPANSKPLGSYVEKRGSTVRKFSVNVKHVVALTAPTPVTPGLSKTHSSSSTTSTSSSGTRKPAFAIDGDIARAGSAVGRHLQPFNDFSDLRPQKDARPGTLDEQTFGDMVNGRTAKKWDQFQVNQDKFGVTTTFDEDEYTTKIDTRDARFAEREKEAAKLASEIEAEQTENVHVRIERNQQIASGFDEEALHSGVDRSHPKEAAKPLVKPAPPKPKPAPAERPKSYAAAAAAGPVKNHLPPHTTQKSAQPPATKPISKPSTSSASARSTARTTGAITPTKAPTADTHIKERESAVEKKLKTSSLRSSRDNLPQLAKVRAQSMTGRNSPSQSRNSPLPTPAAAETTAVAVLNLDAQTPNLGPEHIKSFEKYKMNREIRSMTENREKITDDLKKFQTQLDSKNGQIKGQIRRSSSSANASGNSTPATAAEKKTTLSGPKPEAKAPADKDSEAKAEGAKGIQPSTTTTTTSTTKAPEATQKPKPKLKSKLDPNAAEFKLNPDAPPFEPAAQKQVPMNSTSYPMSPYPGGQVSQDYIQNVQPGHQSFPVPMQAMGQIPYGQPYRMIVPGVPGGVPAGAVPTGAVPAGMAPGNSPYPFVQAPPGAFPGQHVPGGFPQSGGMSVSYGYSQMNHNMPMVVAQGPPGMPAGPYPYYGPGPYSGGQVPGGPQLSQPPQHMYGSNQHGMGQMQGGPMYQGGRGGHGHRRGGFNRKGGKHHGQHSHHMSGSAGVSNSDKGIGRPIENGMTNDGIQR